MTDIRQVLDDDDGSEITLHVGEKLDVSLTERRTAGYRWRVASDGGPVCEILEDVFGATPDRLGRPGTRRWRLQAVRPGTGTLSFEYMPLRTGDPSPERTFRLSVNVT